MEEDGHDGPLFSAVSSSARQLYMLLRCISFGEKAQKAQVQISAEGLRFSVEQTSVMEGIVFINKDLFTTFEYNPSNHTQNANEDNPDNSPTTPPTDPIFSISLPSLLETLQIFNLTDLTSKPTPWSHNHTSTHTPLFSHSTLGITGLLRLTYPSPSSRLHITISEPSVTTTCSLTTYTPSTTSDIPFSRSSLALKTILRATWLHDAISELSAINPDTLTLTASSTAPNLCLSASGPLGSTSVEFSSSSSAGAKNSEPLLETFQIAPSHQQKGKVTNSYAFPLIKHALKAMSVASKVSIRGDEQGVLSLQFMVEVEGGGSAGKVCFVDWRFVPLVEGEDGVGRGMSSGSDDSEEEDEGREGMGDSD